jgi:GT2 family glycosyltransferase
VNTDSERVVAVVVTYNGSQYIRSCLQSLLAGPEPAPKIVVVDNASTDGTVELLRDEFPQLHVIAHNDNAGYGGGSNIAAELVHARYMAFVNQDVVSTPGWIQRLVDELEQDQSAAMATPMVLIRDDPQRVNACGNVPHYTGITVCRGYRQLANEFREIEDISAVSGAAFVIRKEVFEELGRFDSDFFLYLEDTDLSLRALLAGYRCILVPDATVLHDFEPRFAPEKIAFLERNRLLMLLKMYRWRTMLALAPALLLTELMVLAFSALRGGRCTRAKLGAYGWVIARLPAILRSRRRTQMTRRVSDGALLRRLSADLDLIELESPIARWALPRVINPIFRSWYRVSQVMVAW